MMYNISGKTGFDQARYTNKNSGTTLRCTSEKCQNQIKIYAASRLAYSGEWWRGKPSVLLADTQSRHATQTMPGHPQTTAKCMHHHRHSHQLHQNTQRHTRYSLTDGSKAWQKSCVHYKCCWSFALLRLFSMQPSMEIGCVVPRIPTYFKQLSVSHISAYWYIISEIFWCQQ